MKKIIKLMVLMFILCSPLSAATISTTTVLVGPQPAILLNNNETLYYSLSSSFTGTAFIEKSRSATNWSPVGISTTNNATGVISGNIANGWRSYYYRWNSSTITAGAFTYLMKDNDDFVTQQLNNKKVPVTQTYDESFRIGGTLGLLQTYSIATTTPTFIGQIALDTNYDVYVASGNQSPSQWIKVGGQ